MTFCLVKRGILCGDALCRVSLSLVFHSIASCQEELHSMTDAQRQRPPLRLLNSEKVSSLGALRCVPFHAMVSFSTKESAGSAICEVLLCSTIRTTSTESDFVPSADFSGTGTRSPIVVQRPGAPFLNASLSPNRFNRPNFCGEQNPWRLRLI